MNLKDVFKNNDVVNGQTIIVMDKLKEDNPEMFNEGGGMDWKVFERDIRPFNYVYVRHDKNSISFTVEDKERGIKGCSLGDIFKIAQRMYEQDHMCKCKTCKCKEQ